jgi:hypothetical protein
MRNEGYTEEILAKLDEIAQLCGTEKVDYALYGGDFFNSKVSARVSHNLVNASLRALDKFPCPLFFIVGSHDVPYGRLDLLYKRPIGTILRHPKVTYLEDSFLLGDVSGGPSIRLLPVSDAYNNTTEEVVASLKAMREKHEAVDYNIALLHQPVVKEGSFPYPVVQSADLVGTADFVLFGHMHNYDGVWELSVDNQKTTFANVGAVSRGSLDEKTLLRTPTILIFDITFINIDGTAGLTLREVPLKSAKPVAEVFRLSAKQEQMGREVDIEALLHSVKATHFGTFSPAAAIARIKSMAYAQRDDLLPAEGELSEAHFERVKQVSVELLEELGE